eukprot:gene13247-15264_t
MKVSATTLLTGADTSPHALPEAKQAVLHYIIALHEILPFPSDTLSEELNGVVALCCISDKIQIMSHETEKLVCGEALRMTLLLYGRDRRQDILDAAMLRYHEKNPSTGILMSSSPVYRIVESADKGKIAVATRDILPGELIVKENEPILHVSSGNIVDPLMFGVATYKMFANDLSLEQKDKVVELFGPTEGEFAECMRTCALQARDRNYVSADEVETLTKVMLVVSFNAFELIENDKIHHRHSSALPIAKAYMVMYTSLVRVSGKVVHDLPLPQCTWQAAMDYMEVLRHLFPSPSDHLSEGLNSVVSCCITQLQDAPIFSPAEEKSICGEALRMHLLLYGRDRREKILDEAMLRSHEKLPCAGTNMNLSATLLFTGADTRPSLLQEAKQAALDYITALFHILPLPSDSLSDELNNVVALCCRKDTVPILTPEAERLVSGEALRMRLLLYGRDWREKTLDE